MAIESKAPLGVQVVGRRRSGSMARCESAMARKSRAAAARISKNYIELLKDIEADNPKGDIVIIHGPQFEQP